ncbi:hypothetical protein GCM10027161_07820 [Microbispora hainanensis]
MPLPTSGYAVGGAWAGAASAGAGIRAVGAASTASVASVATACLMVTSGVLSNLRRVTAGEIAQVRSHFTAPYDRI